jgi:HEPN domain-containing protein
MTEIYLEWIEKAEGDYHTSFREYRSRKYPNYDSACFHAQQCVEKYLKGFLQKVGVYFPKTHDLNALLDLLLPIKPFLEVFRNDLKMLSVYAIDFRYPGESATKEEAKEAIRAMKKIRSEFRVLLNLD